MVYGSDENYPGESLERMSEEDKEIHRELVKEPEPEVSFSPADIAALADDSEADLALAVAKAAEEEEAKAQLDFVRGQRDALLLAVKAVDLFHRAGGLVSIDELREWSALTGETDFSVTALMRFVRAKMKEARCA